MIIKAEEGQTIYDITVQYYGNINKLQKLLDDNKLNRNSILHSGQELFIDDYYPKDIVTNYFINRSVNNDDSIKEYNSLQNDKVHIINIEQPKNPILNNEWIVEEGQTIYDIATMFYGSPNKVTKLIEDNKDLNYNTVLYSGQRLKLTFENNELNNVIYANNINSTDTEYRYFSELTVKVLRVGYETPEHLGFIYIDVYGGTKPYTFSWSNGATTQNLLSIHTGTYTLTVTDDDSTQKDITIFVQFYNPYNKYLVAPATPGDYYSNNYNYIVTDNGDRILINNKNN